MKNLMEFAETQKYKFAKNEMKLFCLTFFFLLDSPFLCPSAYS